MGQHSKKRLALAAIGAMLLAWGCTGFGHPAEKQPPQTAPDEEAITSMVGTGQGFRGPIAVAVQVEGRSSGYTLVGIEILSHSEDPFIGGSAMEELLELALDGNTTDLDAIAGATESSMGFLSALEDALRQGGKE